MEQAMDPIGEAIAKAIDKSFHDNQDDGLRNHLGASVLGDVCVRAIWYKFRWAKVIKHTGRMLRLFQRGHDQEKQVTLWLRQIGAVVHETDPETGKQFRVSDHAGHFGGSSDGIVGNLERFGLEGYGLLEDKTHNEKSFKQLLTKGVVMSKPGHWVQMQMYMGYLGLKWALYFPVCKNDDHIQPQVIHFKPEAFERYSGRALDIITARKAPPKIREDPSWWVCKFCDFKRVCHEGAELSKNCRSCVFATAELTGDGVWRCNKFCRDIPKEFIRKGCDDWTPVA